MFLQPLPIGKKFVDKSVLVGTSRLDEPCWAKTALELVWDTGESTAFWVAFVPSGQALRASPWAWRGRAAFPRGRR